MPLCLSKIFQSPGKPVNSPVCALKPTCVKCRVLYGDEISKFFKLELPVSLVLLLIDMLVPLLLDSKSNKARWCP